MQQQRRSFLKKIGGVTAGAIAVPLFNPLFIEKVEAAALKVSHLSPKQAAQDEDFWFTVQQAYTSSPSIINLNNGGVSPQPLVVQDAENRYTRTANEGPAYFMWKVLGGGRETIRKKLAALSGCSPEEIAINRNSTESLETIIYGIPMQKGDEVIMCNQDYGSMRSAFYQRAAREGIVIKEIKIPVPPKNLSEITAIYEQAITPKTKYLLVTHMINLTGQLLPVKEICDMAHKRGIEVIVDSAHAYAHVDFKIPDLHCDYFGTSLHKWLCCPFGTGMMYIKKDKIAKVWPLFSEPNVPKDSIKKFEHLGTHSYAAELAIGHAINFHKGIGGKRKEERMRFLKNYWAEKVIKLPGVKLNTSLAAEQSCGLANFSIEGKKPKDICDYLFKNYKIFVIPITKGKKSEIEEPKKMYPGIQHEGIDFEGVRVTPHVYTTLLDLDLLVQGVEKFCKG